MNYLDLASIEAGLAGAGTIDHLLVSAVADENAKRGALAAVSLMANPHVAGVVLTVDGGLRLQRGVGGLHLELAPKRCGTVMLIG